MALRRSIPMRWIDSVPLVFSRGERIKRMAAYDGPGERILLTGTRLWSNFRHAGVCDWAAADTNFAVIRR